MPRTRTLTTRYAALWMAAVLLNLPAWAQSSRLDPAFPPVQVTQTSNGTTYAASIYDVVRQADGKYIIAGNFTAINGLPASRLARLEANGTLDAAFTAACPANGTVTTLAVQPDGRILAGGSFTSLAGAPRTYIGRLETSGALDASFAPYTPPARTAGGVSKLLVQPDGQVLVCGLFNLRGVGQADQHIVRLNGSGQYDPSFQFTLPTPDTSPQTILLQPDGHVLVGGYGPSYRQAAMLLRLRPDGTKDTNFTTLESTFTAELNGLEVDAAGRIYAAGAFQNGPGNPLIRRYLPNGTLDPAFNYPRSFSSQYAGMIKAVALQPNGRLLVAHSQGAERLLPDGSFDTSFLTGIGGSIQRYLVQPDGGIMVAGTGLTGPGLTGSVGLLRILDTNVLRVQLSAADARTAAWPVPTHDVLYLQLDAASRPRRVQLLDALGRPVLTLEQPAATLALPVAGLAAGMYQVQVEYAEASRVVRRIVLQ